MTDNRFPSPGVDARFPSVGVDARFPSPGEDVEHLPDGTDTRFQGSSYGSPQIINYAPTFTAVSAQPVWAGQAPSAAFPAGVENTTNYQSSAGTISTATRQVSVNGAAFTATLTGNLDPGQTVAIRVRVVDSAANERFFPSEGGSVTTAQALPMSSVVSAPAITTTGKIGASQSRTAATWSAIPGTPAGMAREIEGRWLVNGVSVSTSTTYTPLESGNNQPLVREERARHTLNGKASTWSDWSASAAVTVTYNAPVASGTVPAQNYVTNSAITPLDLKGFFTVTGDADLSGTTFTLAPSSAALPPGLSLSSVGVLSGTPTSEVARNLVIRATNSGGFADQAFTATVADAVVATLTSVSFNDASEEWSITTDTLGVGNFRIATSLTTEAPTFTPGTGWSANALESFSVAVGATGPVTVNVGTLSSATGNTGDTRRVSIVQDTGVVSNYLRENFTVDRTAPTISSTSVTAGNTQLTYNWSVNETGTRWHVVTTSATVPSVAQIKAGQNHLGATATASGTGAVTATGSQTALVATGLTNGTAYWFHVIVEDAHRNVSAVSTVTGTPAAAGAPVFLGFSSVGSTFDTVAHTAPVSLASGTRYAIGLYYQSGGGAPTAFTLTVNGTAATVRGLSVNDDGAFAGWFEVVPGSTGTSVSIGRNTSGPGVTHLAYYQIPAGVTFQTNVASTATLGDQRVVSPNVDANDMVLAIAVATQVTSFTWAGVTQDGTNLNGDFRISAASASGVSAATPRVVTADRVGPAAGNGNLGFSAASIVFGV